MYQSLWQKCHFCFYRWIFIQVRAFWSASSYRLSDFAKIWLWLCCNSHDASAMFATLMAFLVQCDQVFFVPRHYVIFEHQNNNREALIMKIQVCFLNTTTQMFLVSFYYDYLLFEQHFEWSVCPLFMLKNALKQVAFFWKMMVILSKYIVSTFLVSHGKTLIGSKFKAIFMGVLFMSKFFNWQFLEFISFFSSEISIASCSAKKTVMRYTNFYLNRISNNEFVPLKTSFWLKTQQLSGFIMRTEQSTKCLYHVSNWGWGWYRKTCLSPPVFHYWSFLGGGSDVVLCCLFLVSEFRWCFTLCLFIIPLVRFGLLSDHLLGNSCPLG